jgi:glutamine synthetase
MLDGIVGVANLGLNSKELEREISKEFGVEGKYLDRDRVYRSEEDVFEHFTEAERNRVFGSPPATVWENLRSFEIFEDKLAVLKRGNVFSQELIQAYKETILSHWAVELENRIIPDNIRHVRSCKVLHLAEEYTDLDVVLWKKIHCIRKKLTKDSLLEKSLFTRIKEALKNQEYRLASALQLEMAEAMKELDELYLRYKTNMTEA